MIELSDNLINEELAKAGTDPVLIAKLKKDRITVDKELPPMEFLLKLFDVPCCPRGELVAFTGKAKSGKTFVMSMMMAAAGIVKTVISAEKIAQQTGLNAKYLIVRDDGSWEVDYHPLFHDAFIGQGELQGGELRNRVMELCGMKSVFQYNQLRTKAIEGGLVCMRTDGKKHFYRLSAPD